jgi:prevent-host-death family protein
MIKVNIAEVKAKLSEYLELTARGERVLICKHNRPVAELRAVETTRAEPRLVGGAAGQFTVPAGFFDPLPDDFVAGFMGADAEQPTMVAEGPVRYAASTTRAAKKRTRR